MNAKECITGRRSIRKFKDTPVSDEILADIVETASYAPSWKNSQVTRYIAVKDNSLKDKIADDISELYDGNTRIIKGAPLLIVVTLIKGRSGYERDGSFSTPQGTHFQSFDAGLATEAFCLAAHEKGLGTVIMGIYDENKVKSVLSIPDEREVACLIAIGTPDEEPAAPRRKSVEDLLTFI